MSSILIKLAQFTYIIWPLFIVTAFAYSLQIYGGRNWLRTLGHRLHKNLFFTWLLLFLIWIVTLVDGDPVPTLLPEPANSIIFFSGLGVLLIIELNQLRFFPIRIQARMDMHAARAINDLNRMNPSSFEELVAETYRTLGYYAQRTGHSGDHGIDVELRTVKGERWIVQCKRSRDSVGEGIVRELFGTLTNEKASRAVLVTSAEITPPAEAWARGKPIDLIDGRQFLKLMEKARQKAAGSLFERFTTWLETLIKGYQTPPALRQASPASQYRSSEQTRPIRILPQPMHVEIIGPPSCPHCQIPMVTHPGHPRRRLYRCKNYPSCRVVVDGRTNQ